MRRRGLTVFDKGTHPWRMKLPVNSATGSRRTRVLRISVSCGRSGLCGVPESELVRAEGKRQAVSNDISCEISSRSETKVAFAAMPAPEFWEDNRASAADSVGICELTSSFLALEHLDQVRERIGTLIHDVDRMLASLRSPPLWHRGPLFVEALIERLGALRRNLVHDRQIIYGYLDRATERVVAAPHLDQHLMRLPIHVSVWERRYALLAGIARQRLTPEDAPDWMAFFDRGADFRALQRLYRAADAVLLGLFEDIFGVEWIRHSFRSGRQKWQWLPLALFSRHRIYSMDNVASVAILPASEIYRVRRWAALAHEIGHLRIHRLFQSRDALYMEEGTSEDPERPGTWPDARRATVARLLCMSPEDEEALGTRVREVLNAYARLLETVERVHLAILATQERERCRFVLHHAHELLADWIGIRVVGPAAALAFLTMSPRDLPRRLFRRAGRDGAEVEEMALAETRAGQEQHDARMWAAGTEHPPDYVRVLLMRRALQDSGLGSLVPLSSLKAYCRGHPLLPSLPRRQYLVHWLRQRDALAHDLRILSRYLVACKPFDGALFQRCIALYDSGRIDASLSGVPRIALNLGWIKRASVHRMVFERADLPPRGLESSEEINGYELFACGQQSLAFSPLASLGRVWRGPAPGMFGALVHALADYGDERLRRLRTGT